jgi:hypothetical protein
MVEVRKYAWVVAAVVAMAAHLPADTVPPEESLAIDTDAADPSAWVSVSNSTGKDQTYQVQADAFVSLKDQSPAQIHSTKPTAPVQLTFTPNNFSLKTGDSQSVKATWSHGGRLLAGRYQSTVSITSVGDGLVRAKKTVVATVAPVVLVTPVSSVVDAGTVRVGFVTTVMRYTVDANVQHIQFSVTATDLYLGGDPTQTAVTAIALNPAQAADIRAVYAQAAAGNAARFDATPTQLSGMRAFNTQALAFDSKQAAGFRQDMFVTLTWQQNEALKASGAYTGCVRLTAIVIP